MTLVQRKCNKNSEVKSKQTRGRNELGTKWDEVGTKREYNGRNTTDKQKCFTRGTST